MTGADLRSGGSWLNVSLPWAGVGRLSFGVFLGCIIVFMLLPISASASGTVTVFGPQRYELLRNGHNIYTADFVRCEPSSTALLKVVNGADRQTRVRSARILVNGEKVAGEHDFKVRIDNFEKSLSISRHNELKLDLKGGHHGYLDQIEMFQDGLDSAEQDLEKLEALLDELQAAVAQKKADFRPLQKRLSRLREHHGNEEDKHHEYDDDMDPADWSRAADYRARLAAFRARLSRLRDSLERRDEHREHEKTERKHSKHNRKHDAGERHNDRNDDHGKSPRDHSDADDDSRHHDRHDDGRKESDDGPGEFLDRLEHLFAATVARMEKLGGRLEALQRRGPAFIVVEIIGQGCDVTPPAISLEQPAAGALLATARPRITASFTDEAGGAGIDSGSVRLFLDGVDVTTVATVTSTGIEYLPASVLAEGRHTASLEVSDLAGNGSEQVWHFTTDTIPPVVSITSHVDNSWLNTPTVMIAGRLDDPTARVTVNGEVAAVADGHFSSNVYLGEGANQIAVIAVDPAGNSSSTGIRLQLDTVAPVVTINSPQNGWLTNVPQTDVTAVVNEPVLSAEIDGRPVVVNGATLSLSDVPLVEGENMLGLVVTDRAGNRSEATVVVTLDTIAPLPPVFDALPGPTNRAAVTLSGNAEAGSLVRIFRELSDGTTVPVGSAQADESGRFSLPGLTLREGTNRFRATASDAAGNEGSPSMPVSAILDTTPPQLVLDAPSDQLYTNQTFCELAGSADEPLASVMVNGVAANVSGSDFSLAGIPLVEGPNNLDIVASDPAGNTARITRIVNRDTVAPVVTITTPVSGLLTRHDRVAVAATVDEPILTAAVNGREALIEGQDISLVGVLLNEGQNTLRVTVGDRAGNQTTVEVAIIRDSTPPSAPVITPPVSPTNQAMVSLQGTAEADAMVEIRRESTGVSEKLGVVLADGDGRFLFPDVTLQEGENIFTATATDAAGNISEASPSERVVLDTLPPEITLANPLAGQLTNQPELDVAGRVDEPVSSVAINGRAAMLAGQEFSLAGLSLHEGVNRIEVTASDLAGNTATVTRMVTRDSVAPVISVSSPADGSVSDLLDIVVSGTVDEADALLTIDGVSVPLSGGAFSYPLTLQPGSNTLILLATDPAGNTGTTSLTIQTDGTPPTVTIASPVSGNLTNQSTVTLVGGVDEEIVALTLNGQPVAFSGGSFTIPVDLVEGDNRLDVAATDRAGNIGSTTISLRRDSRPPRLDLSGPLDVEAGGTVSLQLQADDASPLSLVELRSGAVVIWSGGNDGARQLSQVISYSLPPELAVGDQPTLRAAAVDAAGNRSEADLTLNVARSASGPGYLQGEVYDDSRGLRLAGATVSVRSGGNEVASVSSDAAGGYFFELTAGDYLLRLSKRGYTTVERLVRVQPSLRLQVRDARLTPRRGEAQRFDLAGGLLRRSPGNSVDAALELEVPADLLNSAVDLRLFPLSNQGLPAPLPLGWAPLGACELRAYLPDTTEPAPVGEAELAGSTLRFPLPGGLQIDADSRLLLAAYDPEGHTWIAAGSVALAADQSTAQAILPGGGYFALLLADETALAPPPATLGQPLPGGAAGMFDPAAVAVAGRVVPYAAPPHEGLLAAGELTLDETVPGALPSGTVLTGRVLERFELNSGETVQPAEYRQDLILYRAPCVTNIGGGRLDSAAAALRTTFPVSPSRDFTVVDLLQGKVGIEILPPGEDSSGILVGPDGARLVDADGNVLEIPPGALATRVPVQSRSLTSAELPVGPDFMLLGAVEVDFTGQLLTGSATLSIPAPGELDPALPLLLARQIEIAGAAKLKLVGSARLSGSLVVSSPSLAAATADGPVALTLSGINRSGRYFLLQAREPIGFARGQVSNNSGNPFSGGLVSSDNCSLVDLTDSNGRYLLPLGVGPFTVMVLDPGMQDTGSAGGTVPEAGRLLDLDLTLLSVPPVVTAIVPADGAGGVEPSVAPRIIFSEALDRSSVDPAAIRLYDSSGQPMAGTLSFNPDGSELTFYPAATLSSEATYTLSVAGTIRDRQGYPLGQSFTSTFTIRDTTPPPLPPAGSISATFPDVNGLITVTGTRGSVELGATVLVINDTSGEIVGVAPRSDGSFSTSIAAQLGDEIQVVMMDAAGNQTLISYLTFKSDDDRYLVTAKGGKVAGEGGSQLDIPDGALLGPAVVKLTSVAEDALPHPVPPEANFLAAVNLDNGGLPFQKEVKLSIPAPAGLPAGAQFFVAQPKVHVNADGSEEQVYVIIDSAKLLDGRITTASPPFAGIRGFGIYTFLMAQPSVGPVIISGTTYRDIDGNPGYLSGVDRPITGAVIRSPGAYNFIAYSDAAGHYAAYGFSGGGVCRNFAVTAIHPLTMFRNEVNLSSCDAPYIVNNLNFQLADAQTEVPDTVAPDVRLSLAVAAGQAATIVAGTVPVGTLLEIPVRIVDQDLAGVKGRIEFETPLMASPQVTVIDLLETGRSIYRDPRGEEPPVYQYDYQARFPSTFGDNSGLYLKVNNPGTYTLIVEAVDGSGNSTSRQVWIRAVDQGEIPDGVDGNPRIDELLPRNGAEDVLVNVLISAAFNEPVQGVTAETFQLIDLATGQPVPSYISTRLEAGHMFAYLAPKRNLLYDHGYEIVLTQGITDHQGNLSAGGGNLSLDREYRFRFHTKRPRGYDLPDDGERFRGGFDIALYNDYRGQKVYSYVAAQKEGWRIVDVTDPITPSVVGSRMPGNADSDWFVRGVAVDQATGVLAVTEDIRYVSGGQYGYVRFYDLYTNPLQPALIGREKLAENFSGIPGKVVLYGRFAYIATIGAGLQVVDVEAARDHAGPADGSSIVGLLDTIGEGYGQPWDMVVYAGGRALLTTSYGYLLVLDLSLPQLPRVLSAFRPDNYRAARVAVAPDYQFTDEAGLGRRLDLGISVGLDGRLWSVDLSDPYNPQLLGSAVDEAGAEVFITARDLVISPLAGLVYVTTFNAIQIYDIRNPYQPQRLANISILPGPDGEPVPVGAIPALVEQNGWLFMADQVRGLRVFDLDPVSIRLTGNRVVVLDQDGKALKPSIDYTIQATDENFGSVTVDIYRVEKDAAGQVTGESLYRSYPTGRKKSGSADISAETFPLDQTFYARVIVNKGITGKQTRSVKIPFIQQAVLVPDYDHNRVIDATDRARARAGDVFYFWINDDDDQGDLEGDDIPGASSPDWDNAVIDGTRDLEDFFPVSIDLSKLLDIYPPWQYPYRLKTVGENLNIAFTDLGEAESGSYLTAAGTDMTREIVFSQAKTVAITGNGVDLYKLDKEGGRTFMDRMRQQKKPGVILVEGCQAGTTPLLLEITDVNGNKVFSSQLNLSLAGVEMMFRQKNLIQPLLDFYQSNAFVTPDHVPTSALGKPDRLQPEDFVDGGQDYSAHFTGFEADNDGHDFVFVHGYNVNGTEASGAQSEIFKRLYWSGSKARFWGITWYGWDSQTKYPDPLCIGERSINYHINVRHAWYTGQLLKYFAQVNNLSNATFAAHSLGNMVMASAIQQGMGYHQYFMVNAAVAEEAYIPKEAYTDGLAWESSTRQLMYHPSWRYPHGDASEFGYKPFLWASEWYKQFGVDDYRQSLTWRNVFNQVTANQGNGPPTYVFFSSNDEVFRPFTLPLRENYGDLSSYPTNIDQEPGIGAVWQNRDCQDVPKLGTYSWSFQELLKGRGGITDLIDLFGTDSRYGGWGFNLDTEDGYVEVDIDPETGFETAGPLLPPEVVNMTDSAQLKEKPFFSKNPDNSFLYSADPLPEQSVANAEAKRIELLANEFPALTYAAGHRGVWKFDKEFNVDIRAKFIDQGRWPRDDQFLEWRHNDIYFVGYPYLFGLFDGWVSLITEGVLP